MRFRRAFIAVALVIAALGLGLTTAQPASAQTTPDYNCHDWSYGKYGFKRALLITASGKYSKARPYGTATKIMLLERGETKWSNYWCKNKYGNIWYHLSDFHEEIGYGYAYSEYFYILG